MSEFEVKVKQISKVEYHPNADLLDLVHIDDYVCIVGRDTHVINDMVVYIPEAAIVPEWLLEEIGLVGKLAGKAKNRVKAMKLRGVVSQGLVYPVIGEKTNFPDACTFAVKNEQDTMGVMVGDDVTEFLGIAKYEPQIPSSMSGEVFNAVGQTIHFDIENIKKYPTILEEGEEVAVTEKLHGTWCCMGFHPDVEENGGGRIVTSKGLSGRGLAFKFNEQNEKNLYVQMYHQLTNGIGQDIMERFCRLDLHNDADPFYILGEVYGKGVQDLAYVDDNEKAFRVFDIFVGEPTGGHYLTPDEVKKICQTLDIDMVPWLYSGPYSKEMVEELTNGKETVSGKELHMREGIVIRPFKERRDDEIGRVILKSVSDAYLLRKGKTTEFN